MGTDPHPQQIRIGKGKYCSKSCANRAQVRTRKRNKTFDTSKFSAYDIGYLAGLLDGEGNIYENPGQEEECNVPAEETTLARQAIDDDVAEQIEDSLIY